MLSAEQRAFLETFGFVVLHNAFSPDGTSEILRNFDDVLDEARQGQEFDGQRRQIVMAFGVVGPELPHFALESNPGDVVIFNQAIWHSSFGGRSRRRMFTLFFAEKPDHLAYLRQIYEFNLTQAANGRVYDEDLLASDSARIQGMVKPLLELGCK